jgi:hypothetical protein
MDNYNDSDLLDVTLPTLTTILQLKTKEMSDLLEGGISIESEESLKLCEQSLEFANQIQEYNRELYTALAEYCDVISLVKKMLMNKISIFKKEHLH